MNVVACPWCGEPAETYPDLGGGEAQQYVEDCAVCCRPIRYLVRWDETDRDFELQALRED